MANSDKHVTFCIFPGIKRRDEAIIFKTINATQKRIDTSLVDAIVLITDPSAPSHIRWAWDLGVDPGSSFNRRVAIGGRNLSPPARLVTLRTLAVCTRSIIPVRTLSSGADIVGYTFLRNFWNVVSQIWPSEFMDSKQYKLMTAPGLRGLVRFGKHIFLRHLPAQDVSAARVLEAFKGGPMLVDWSVAGQVRDATGNAGARIVYEALIAAYSTP